MKNKIFCIILGLAVFSCSGDGNPGDDHGHDEVKLLIQAYSESYEVFAEADPFIQGSTSQILVHVTHLESFKPLEQGKATLSLITGSQGIRQTLDSPLRPGIYLFNLQPQLSGNARLILEIEQPGETHSIECGRTYIYTDAHHAIHAAEELMVQHPGAISFTKEQSWLVDFQTTAVQTMPLGVVLKTVGEVLPSQGDEIMLSAQTNGVARFVKSSLYEGISVEQGEVLLNISGEGLAEGNTIQRYQQAENNLERARADYERISKLAENRIVTQGELLQAKNDYENARSIFSNLSGNFSASGQQIRSPIKGYLTQLHVSPGQFVQAGQVIATVARQGEVIIMAEVQQRHAAALSGLNTANFVSPDGSTYTMEDLDGVILSRARNLNARSHLLPVYLQVNNLPQWVTGTLVDVYLKTTHSAQGVVVPNTSLIEEQGNYFVFVQLHPESFEKREVKIGVTDGIYTQIQQGLAVNERIVSKGGLLVKMAAVSSDIDPHSGHVH